MHIAYAGLSVLTSESPPGTVQWAAASSCRSEEKIGSIGIPQDANQSLSHVRTASFFAWTNSLFSLRSIGSTEIKGHMNYQADGA